MGKVIIFVSGLLAAGKTTLSEYLSDKLHVLLINKDYVKEILCDTVGFTNREENLKLSNATHQLMRHIAENSMKIGLPIILESNFNPDDANYFEGEIQKYDYKPITIQLTGDKKFCLGDLWNDGKIGIGDTNLSSLHGKYLKLSKKVGCDLISAAKNSSLIPQILAMSATMKY